MGLIRIVLYIACFSHLSCDAQVQFILVNRLKIVCAAQTLLLGEIPFFIFPKPLNTHPVPLYALTLKLNTNLARNKSIIKFQTLANVFGVSKIKAFNSNIDDPMHEIELLRKYEIRGYNRHSPGRRWCAPLLKGGRMCAR